MCFEVHLNFVTMKLTVIVSALVCQDRRLHAFYLVIQHNLICKWLQQVSYSLISHLIVSQ